MYLYGASGHSKVIADILSGLNIQIKAVLDDNPSGDSIFGIPVVHSNTINFEEDDRVLVSIGNNAIRKKVVGRLNTSFAKAVHPSSFVSASALIGDGTVVMPRAVVNASSVVGKHVIVNSGAVVEHDCFISDFVHISPNASLAGNVHVGEGTHVGIGASVIQGIQIGKWVTIGAGSVIIKDVPDFSVVVGNPGRIVKTKELF